MTLKQQEKKTDPEMKLTVTQSTKTINVVAKDTKIELKNANIFKKGTNLIRIEVTKRGYIVKVNDEDLQ